MQNSLANTENLFTKCFWRAGKVRIPDLRTCSALDVVCAFPRENAQILQKQDW